jgi:hypothetical protein
MIVTIVVFIKELNENIVLYSIFPKHHNKPNIPKVRKQSPTLLVKNAEIEL